MLNLFKRNKTKTWSQLTAEQRSAVSSKIAKHIVAMAGSRYKIVSGFDEFQRERGVTETKSEDEISQYGRGRLLSLARNAVRNSATFNTILKQMDFNVCGTQAGKAVIDFQDIDLSKKLRDMFAKHTRSIDFFDGYNFNTLLKMIVKNALIGGDCVLVFDDGLFLDSGKVLLFESDEIGDVDADIEQIYGAGCRQSLGKVYDQYSRWIGTIVSRSQRGKMKFDPSACYFLRRDPDGNPLDTFWTQPADNIWRTNQRAVTPTSSSLGTILDLEDLCGFELQSAKKNSQTFAQILHTTTSNDEADVPSAFDTDTDFSSMTDEEIEEAVKSEATIPEQTVSLRGASACGILFDAMPDNYKMELLSTNHPNENVQDFVKWLAGRSSAVYGLSEAYATLMPTGADFRAQQLMTQPAFIEAQSWLERNVCDWVMFQFVKWAGKRGMIDIAQLPENWMQCISWQFPQMDELDENSHQDAIAKKLANNTATYKDILGNDWREKLLQSKSEIQWFKDNGLAHPSYAMKSGGQREESMVDMKGAND